MIDIGIIESHRIKLFTHVCGLNNWRSEQVHFKCFIWVVLESGGGGVLGVGIYRTLVEPLVCEVHPFTLPLYPE